MLGLGLQLFRRASLIAGGVLPTYFWNTTASSWNLTYNNWNQ